MNTPAQGQTPGGRARELSGPQPLALCGEGELWIVESGSVALFRSALQEGEPVFLCWQFGEPAITHWHGVDEGYAGRKPLEGVSVRPPSFLN